MRLAIWDLDNCISDDAWRIPFIAWEHADPDARYKRYHELGINDNPGNVGTFSWSLSEGMIPVFITGRPCTFRDNTTRWIRAHFGVTLARPEFLLMRAHGDHRPAAEMKFDAASSLPKRQVVFATDDQRDVVQMYRWRLGFNAVELRIHDVCAYNRPRS